MVSACLWSEVVLSCGHWDWATGSGYLELISEAESLFLEHIQNTAVLLLYRLPLHQLQISFVNFILQKSEQKYIYFMNTSVIL